MTIKQCKKCPWRKSTNPRDIPGGYCEKLHEGLRSTIANPEESPLSVFGGALHLMVCHESPVGRERPCAGWLHNQLGDGNNLALRFAVIQKRVDGDYELVGEQHERFEDTLPQD